MGRRARCRPRFAHRREPQPPPVARPWRPAAAVARVGPARPGLRRRRGRGDPVAAPARQQRRVRHTVGVRSLEESGRRLGQRRNWLKGTSRAPGFGRETEDPLADDVALDLVAASRDAVRGLRGRASRRRYPTPPCRPVAKRSAEEAGNDVGRRGQPLHRWQRERRADPTKVVFFLDGGATCFDATTCAFVAESYDRKVNDDPPSEGGIFDFARADNPFGSVGIEWWPRRPRGSRLTVRTGRCSSTSPTLDIDAN